MFSLTKVYASISLGGSRGQILVCESTGRKTTVLYSHSFACDDFFEHDQISNQTLYAAAMKTEIEAASGFLGRTIKRIMLILPASLFAPVENTQPAVQFTRDGSVSMHDIEQSMNNSSAEFHEGSQRILCLPYQYQVDGMLTTKPPVGALGYQLRTYVVNYYMKNELLADFVRPFSALEIKVADVLPAPMGHAYEASSDEMMNEGMLVLDVRSTTSELSLIAKGVVRTTLSFGYGFEHLISNIRAGTDLSSEDTFRLLRLISPLTTNASETVVRRFERCYGVVKNTTIGDLARNMQQALGKLLAAMNEALNANPIVLPPSRTIHLGGEIMRLRHAAGYLNITAGGSAVFMAHTPNIIAASWAHIPLLGASYFKSTLNEYVANPSYAVDTYVSDDLDRSNTRKGRMVMMAQISQKIVQKVLK